MELGVEVTEVVDVVPVEAVVTNLLAVEEVVLNVAKKATSPVNALMHLLVEPVWAVILNATNAVNKVISLVNALKAVATNVTVARKRDTLAGIVLKPPLAVLELASIVMKLDTCPENAHRRKRE